MAANEDLREEVRSLAESVAWLREKVRSLEHQLLRGQNKTGVSSTPSSSSATAGVSAASSMNEERDEGEEKEAFTLLQGSGRWEELPEELVVALFSALPPAFVAIAARTCRAWFVGAPPKLRNRLSQRAVCSSMPLLRWAVDNGCPLDRDVSAAIAETGQLELLKWARANGGHWDRSTCITAAEMGHLQLLKWAKKNGCPWDEEVCQAAGAGGHLQVLKWLRKHDCLWDEFTVNSAAQQGHLEVVRWAVENGCPCRPETMLIYAMESSDMEIVKWIVSYYAERDFAEHGNQGILFIARADNLDMLRWWVKEVGPPFHDQHEIYEWGAKNRNFALLNWAKDMGFEWEIAIEAQVRLLRNAVAGGLDVLKWVVDNWGGPPFGLAARAVVCPAAAKQGKLDVLLWARENNFPLNAATCGRAAEAGHLNILQWAREQGCEWSTSTCAKAALKGQLHILKWLRQNGCPWDDKVCYNAARNGHLEVLQWAREAGCPWTAETANIAAREGCLNVLKWAVENGCRWDPQSCDAAVQNGHLDVVRWAVDNLYPWLPHWAEGDHPIPIVPESVVMSKQELFELFKLMRTAGHPWSPAMFQLAANGNHLEVMKWLRKVGCPWNEAACAEAAAGGHLEALQWLRGHGAPCEASAFTAAAKKSRLAVMHYLYNTDCPMDQRALSNFRSMGLGVAINCTLEKWWQC